MQRSRRIKSFAEEKDVDEEKEVSLNLKTIQSSNPPSPSSPLSFNHAISQLPSPRSNTSQKSPLRRASSFLDGFGASIDRHDHFGIMEHPAHSGIYSYLYSREGGEEEDEEELFPINLSRREKNRDKNNTFPSLEPLVDRIKEKNDKSDDDDTESNNDRTISSTKNNAYGQAQLLLVSLLENFCTLYDRNPDKNRRLFMALCKQLWNMGILSSADFFNQSEKLRGVYKEAFRTLVLQAIQGIESEVDTQVKLLTREERGNYFEDETSSLSIEEEEEEEDEGEDNGKLSSFSLMNRAFDEKPVISRLETEFKDLELIGRGGFALVFRGVHKIDNCPYAFKRLEFESKSSDSYEKIIREIKSLANLDHPSIVRYHGAWAEKKRSSLTATNGSVTQKMIKRQDSFDTFDSVTVEEEDSSSSLMTDGNKGIGIAVPICNSAEEFERQVSSGFYMIIQMELCQFTLADWIEQRNFLIKFEKPWRAEYSGGSSRHHSRHQRCGTIPSDRMATLLGEEGGWDINPTENCRIFKCIVKALQHIHSKRLIHRDLKPGNILFQVDGDGNYIPKIGDFGLASNVSVAPSESPHYTNGQADQFTMFATLNYPTESGSFNSNTTTNSNSLLTSRSNRTVGVGTCMYAAPEQIRDCDYDEKVDIYSLGIILFELFCPFATRMERQDVLDDLKNGILPSSFVVRWPKEATLIWSCLSSNVEARPSAEQILESEILEQDPEETIERLAKENCTLKKLLEIERERVRFLEIGLNESVKKRINRPEDSLQNELLSMKILN